MVEIIPNWHPVLVHFSVALLVLAALLSLLGCVVKATSLSDQWLITARWSLWLGVLVNLLTLVSGLYAYNTVAHDDVSHAAMTDHRNWALVTSLAFMVLAVYSLFLYRKGKSHTLPLALALLAATVLLGSTAWRGGELVYRYGLGVMSLPDLSDHGHAEASVHEDDGHVHEEGLAMPAMDNSAESLPVERNVHQHVDGEEHTH